MKSINDFNIVNERHEEFGSEGIACGPGSMLGYEVEILIQENDEKLYFQGEWVSEGEGYYFAIRKASVYDIATCKIEFGDEHVELIQKTIESYHNIEDAKESKYYPVFERINTILEENVPVDEDDYDDDEEDVE